MSKLFNHQFKSFCFKSLHSTLQHVTVYQLHIVSRNYHDLYPMEKNQYENYFGTVRRNKAYGWHKNTSADHHGMQTICESGFFLPISVVENQKEFKKSPNYFLFYCCQQKPKLSFLSLTIKGTFNHGRQPIIVIATMVLIQPSNFRNIQQNMPFVSGKDKWAGVSHHVNHEGDLPGCSLLLYLMFGNLMSSSLTGLRKTATCKWKGLRIWIINKCHYASLNCQILTLARNMLQFYLRLAG